MNPLFHALWMLCGLGAVVLAACSAQRWSRISAYFLGFAVGGVFYPASRLPDAVWVGGLAACATALLLFRPWWGILSAFYGGVLAALLGSLMETYGLPRLPALGLAAVLPAVTIFLARRSPAFAPESLREEALLAITALAVAVAVVPQAAAGWQSAVALNIDPSRTSHTLPLWVMLTGAAALASGGLYSVWRHR